MTPAAVKELDAQIRATAVGLIEGVRGKTEIDFVADYSRLYGPAVFLRLFGLGTDLAAEFQALARTVLMVTADPQDQMRAGARIREIIAGLFDEKEKNPGNDWATKLLLAKNDDGTPCMTKAELSNMGFVLFLAGLDTVMASLSFAFRYLAQHPEAREKLRNNKALIPGAVEEMLRVNSVGNNVRVARHDLDFNGVKMKAGDQILLMTTVANRDPEMFNDPHKVDLEREENLHLSFGSGIHRCAGSNLARLEIGIAIEEWLKRIPNFRLKDGDPPRSLGGQGIGLRNLPLVLEQ
jgi:cytochrome P450